MKKLVLALGISCFVLFGALSVQNIYAATSQVEMSNFDKDPKKVDSKKSTDVKATDVKATTGDKSCVSGEAKSGCCASKSSDCKPSDCTTKGDCSKPCPDKK